MTASSSLPGLSGGKIAVDTLGSWARQHPNRSALTFTDRPDPITYATLDERSTRIANALAERGIRPGEVVAFLLPTGPAIVEVAWAAQRSGLIYTAISTRLSPDEVAFIVRDSGARCLIYDSSLAPRVASLIADGTLRRLVVLAVRSGDSTAPVGEYLAAAASAASPVPDPSWAEGTDMLYSSGTTGRPKGVFRPFNGRPAGTPDSATTLAVERFGLSSDSVFLDTGPLYHAAPLRYTLAPHRLGAHSVVLPSFDAEEFLRTVERYRVTEALLVPTMFIRLLRLAPHVRDRYDLSSLRSVWHGAAPCPRDVKKAVIDWLGPILIENYGGTEGNGVTVVDSHTWLSRPGTVGRAVRGTIRILDEDGKVLPPRSVGLVYFEGGMRFKYHNDPGKTAAAYNSQGWSTMGDMGWLDEDGFLYLSDRRTHLIISGGVNVYPRAAEDALSLHPLVEDVVVVGVPDPEFGEQVKAVVQLRDPTAAGADTAHRLIDFCRDRLDHIACPRSVDFVDTLPREPTGKITTRKVKARYWPEGAL
ncbi:AMP-binding protein [Streptomyces sp. KL116D]|uniref:AMP-binding protein n=1 Tax=Streptomyces sp. KL116D TaxID=3045152 RepID=UPI003556A780